MSGATVTGMARADGADLYFERRGRSLALLLILGGGGDCGYYAALASEYTVITCGRRGNSRSRLHENNAELVMAEQSADALAVLHASGFTSARIFGNSGGATIALDLAAHHPHVAEAVVAHEPPVLAVLPDAAACRAIYDDIGKVLHE